MNIRACVGVRAFRAACVAALAVGGVLPAVAADDEQGASLSDTYGFGAMEILKLDWDLGRPLVSDINGDGLADIVVVNNRRARIELLLQKPDTRPGQADLEPVDPENVNDLFGRERNWRFKRASYPLAVQATSVIVADLNGDKLEDLAYYGPEGLRVALQEEPPKDGSSGLREPRWQPERRWDIADGLKTTEALAVGDLNGDGRPDLVLLAQDGYTLVVQDKEGSFGKPVRQSSSSPNLRQIFMADLNGDGREDLLLWTADYEEFPLRIRLQRPDGTLGPEGRYPIPAASVVEIGRFQGKDTLLSVSRQGGRLAIHALRSQVSSADSDSVSIYPLKEARDADKRAFAAADVDADGLTDVIVTSPQTAEFVVYRGQSGTGFASPQVFPGLKDMRKVCVGRLADEGPESLVVLSVDEKLIGVSRYQNGRLSFPQTVPTAGEPLVCDLADLNRDGQPDLAYVAKVQQSGRDAFALHTILSVGRPQAGPGASLVLEGVEDKPQDLIACDIDQDGLTDLIVVRDFEPLVLIRQTQAGVFAVQRQDQIQAGLVRDLRPQAISQATLGPQQKTVLLLAQGHFVRSVCFDPQRGWQIVDQYPAEPQAQLGLAATFQTRPEDPVRIVGLDDQSGMLTFLEPQPDGTTRAGRQIKVPAGGARKILAGHFTDRSTQGLVVCCDQKLVAVPSQGEDTTLRQVAGFEPDIKDGRLGYLAVGDLNGDGIPEIVACEQNRHHIEILAFDGQGQLASGFTFKVFEEHRSMEEGHREGRRQDSDQPRAVLVSDVTGDGKNDLVVLVHDRIIVYPQE